MKQNILTDFYLEDAEKILKRFHAALPDTLQTIKTFTNKCMLGLDRNKNNFYYTRKQGLLDVSKCLCKQHQHDLDAEINLLMNQHQLKEPFSRECRRKMYECIKKLPGNAKHQKMGNLKKADFDLCILYASGAIPTPTAIQDRPIATSTPIAKKRFDKANKKDKPKKPKKRKAEDQPAKPTDPAVEKKQKKTKGNENGYKPISDCKRNELDHIRNKMDQVRSNPILNTEIFTLRKCIKIYCSGNK